MKRLVARKEMDIVQQVAKEVRSKYESSCGVGVNLSGYCIAASEEIVSLLSSYNIQANTVEGWCIYDDEDYGSDSPYDAHTWVEANVDGQIIYIDVTADQFEYGMDRSIPGIIIGQKPDYMVYDEPVYLLED